MIATTEAPAQGARGAEEIARLIPLAQLEPHPNNVRLALDPTTLGELADSIRASGVLQPLLVTPLIGGERPAVGETYRVIAGHRRRAAAEMVGLGAVPCVVQAIAEGDQLASMLVENVQRESLTPIEEARGFDRLAAIGLSHAAIAKRLGITASRVAQRLQLLALPDDVQTLVHESRLSIGGALALSRVPNADVARRCAQVAARGHWSEKQIVAIVEKELKAMGPRSIHKKPAWKDPEATAVPPGKRRAQVLGWLGKATGQVSFAQIANAASRACTVCGMEDAESVCADCPMLELLDQLAPLGRARDVVPRSFRVVSA